MRTKINRWPAAALAAAVCLFFLLTPGGETSGAGHEHAHGATEGEWATVFGIIGRAAAKGAVMALLGIAVFRAFIWPDMNGDETTERIVRRLEKAAAVVVLYVLMFSDQESAWTLSKMVVAVLTVLVAWDTIPIPRISRSAKLLCPLALIPLIHADGGGGISTSADLLALLAETLHTYSMAIWFGGGLALFCALSQAASEIRTELPFARFMTWSAAAWWGFATTDAGGVLLLWNTRENGAATWILIELLLSVLIALIVRIGYRNWNRDRETKGAYQPFRFKQNLRLSLSLTVVVLLVSALFSRSVPLEGALREPLYWHVMGIDAHMSLRVSPSKGASGQLVRLDIWLPSGMGKPASAEVSLGREERRMTVPLSFKEGGPDPYGFEGFDKYTYEAEGSYIDANGVWKLEVAVVDEAGKSYAYEKEEVLP
ncbi:hypothetical protein [Cohnella cellulosilytica]|uniref:Copper resistance protein CopC n=1 Tax=Cohnella cellulosilytica TaxID=986710 RepID=A0ABW2FHH7_9BACL